jgi:chaperone modulatory protein CbpM
MDQHEFLRRACLEAQALEAFIATGWIVCSSEPGGQQFTDLDVARAQLIHDLQHDIGVNDEGIGVILDLIDKLHGMRRTLGTILSAIHAQPQDVRERLIVSSQRAMMHHHSSQPADQQELQQRGKDAADGDPHDA